MLIGALEAGGTKMVCAIGEEGGEIREQISIPTKTPDETLAQIAEYFRKHRIGGLGIGCFGPIDLLLHPSSHPTPNIRPRLRMTS